MVEEVMEKRRSKVTPEHLEEARKLKAIWDRERPRLKAASLGTQEAFGHHYDIGNQSAVGFFLNGQAPLSLKAAVAFARGLGCAVSDFSDRLARQLRPGEIAPPPSTVAGRVEMIGQIMQDLDGDKQRFLLAFAEQIRGPMGAELIDFLKRLPPRIEPPIGQPDRDP